MADDKHWNSQAWPFWSWPAAPRLNPLAAPVPAGAPQSLTQPILPWVFAHSITVTEKNSSFPEMELEIVARESYGRQLGHVIHALQALIEERPKSAPKNEAMLELLALSRKIDAIKAESSELRVSRLESDLAWLKEQKPDDYQRIASKFSVQSKGRR